MYFFTISIFNQNETRHRTKDKSTKSKTKKWKRKCYNFFNAANIYKAKTNSYPILLRKQGYRFDIKGLKVAK